MPKPTIVFLSTYLPRECGIATFTQDLLKSSQKFLGSLVNCKVAALNLSPLDTHKYPKEVEWEIDQNSKIDHLRLAKTINNDQHISGVIIQHEYGIFGGPEGELLLTFMKACKKSMLVTLHTTLPTPSLEMKSITAKIINLASTIVVLTHRSKNIIENLYPGSLGKVFVVPHGIHLSIFSDPKKFKTKLELGNRIVLTTFGLLSRGKGIEYALKALPKVIKKHPSVLYLILGETHPIIRRNEGEKYRLELAKLITELNLEKHVKFYDQYFNLPDLLEFLQATDVYIATSINPHQAVSGTLSYALGTGLAVVSTEFAQAKEIVTPKTGRLVPIKDSPALTKAIVDLLSDKKRLKQMHLNAYKMTRPMLWSNVADKYTKLLTRLVVPKIKLTHLQTLTDDFGIFQFASLASPNKDFGYTLDDNARALIVCSWLIKQAYTKELEVLLRLYLAFVKKCQLTDGSFVNYIGFNDKLPTPQNKTEDLQDSQTRALWALGEITSNQILPNDIRSQAKKMFLLNLKLETKFTHLRAKAFAIKSFSLILSFLPEKQDQLLAYIKDYADSLLTALKNNSDKSWQWFESDLNYNNALLSESLLIAGKIMKNDEYTSKGLISLNFLISKTFSETYIPIGHSKWYKNKQKRSNFDQQPEDPASMILALISAYNYTGDEHYKKLADKCFSWFLGNNSLKKALYDYKNGGCYDGLHPDRVNLNQGAESLISYLMSSFTMSQLQ
ncbi:glycosyltransferase [Candidatus Collierbacteria bacterium]|nr:glycosyltransferase [Candidatus Collierbacteria bacterium]